MRKKFKMFVYKELEILASGDTKSIGRMGWLEARPLVERAPLMHWIEEHKKEKDKLHLVQAMVLL